MPAPFVIDEQLDLVYVAPQGLLTTDDLVHAIEAYARDAAFHPGINVVFDLLHMDEYDIGGQEELGEVTTLIRATRGDTTDYRLAFVVASDDEETLVRISRDVLYLADEAETFYALPEALRWLGRAEAEEHAARLRRRLGGDDGKDGERGGEDAKQA